MSDWVGTWMTAHAFGWTDTGLENQTLRQVVRVTLGGERLRLTFSNRFGNSPLKIGRVQVGLTLSGADLVSGSNQQVTFHGGFQAEVPAGETLKSDPLDFPVAGLTELAVSIHLPGWVGKIDTHGDAHREQYVSVEGDHTTAEVFPTGRTVGNWHLLSGIEVWSAGAAVVAFGDSITDGSCTDPGSYGRWTDLLAEKFISAGLPLSVLNAGISGNRILHDNPEWFGRRAMVRMDWDVLEQRGVSHVIWLEGINDLMHPGAFAPASETVTAQQIIDAFSEGITRFHQHGIRVALGTLLPFKGWVSYSEEAENKRQQINHWIRTSGGPDHILDFDRWVQDPSETQKLLEVFDIGDHLHPSNSGFLRMAEGIDLDFFTQRAADLA